MKKIRGMNSTLVKKPCLLKCGKCLMLLIPLDSNNTISRF